MDLISLYLRAESLKSFYYTLVRLFTTAVAMDIEKGSRLLVRLPSNVFIELRVPLA